MPLDFSLTYILNLSAIIIVGLSTIYGAKAINKLYSDEFAATINWLLILVEAAFIVHLVIFFSSYFGLSQELFTMFVLMSTVFLAMLFFFATYKIIHFLEIYSFDNGDPSEKIKKLVKSKSKKK